MQPQPQTQPQPRQVYNNVVTKILEVQFDLEPQLQATDIPNLNA